MPFSQDSIDEKFDLGRRADKMLAMIFEYMTKMSLETNIHNILQVLADLGQKMVNADRCSVWLHEPTEKIIWTVAGHGLEKVTVDESSGIVGLSIQTEETIRVLDAYADPRFNDAIDRKTGYKTKSLLCIPFRNSEGTVIGAFQAINKKSDSEKFTPQDEEYLTFASTYAGKSLEAFILREELVETQKEMITTMGEIGESRSLETGYHVKRVAQYSYLLASLAGVPDKQAKMLKYASPMHDIGKVAIPDRILLKPGKLTDLEFEEMKTHTLIGYEVFHKSQRALLKTAALIAYEHHERWDGTGYPRGLAGEDIHLFGRITAIADVFDALGSDRVYKKAWPLEKIIDYMSEQSGHQFDPFLVKLFLEHIEKFIAIRDQFKEG